MGRGTLPIGGAMGFYAPGTLVHDARRHGVEVRPSVCVNGIRCFPVIDNDLTIRE